MLPESPATGKLPDKKLPEAIIFNVEQQRPAG
jgi:hypothetical protein